MVADFLAKYGANGRNWDFLGEECGLGQLRGLVERIGWVFLMLDIKLCWGFDGDFLM